MSCFMNFRRARTWIYDKIIVINELPAIDIKNNRGPIIRMALTTISTDAAAASDIDDSSSARDCDFAWMYTQLFGEMQTQTFDRPWICSTLAALVTKLTRLVGALHPEGESLARREEESEEQVVHCYFRLFLLSFQFVLIDE